MSRDDDLIMYDLDFVLRRRGDENTLFMTHMDGNPTTSSSTIAVELAIGRGQYDAEYFEDIGRNTFYVSFGVHPRHAIHHIVKQIVTTRILDVLAARLHSTDKLVQIHERLEWFVCVVGIEKMKSRYVVISIDGNEDLWLERQSVETIEKLCNFVRVINERTGLPVYAVIPPVTRNKLRYQLSEVFGDEFVNMVEDHGSAGNMTTVGKIEPLIAKDDASRKKAAGSRSR